MTNPILQHDFYLQDWKHWIGWPLLHENYIKIPGRQTTTIYGFFWFCGLAGWSFCPSCPLTSGLAASLCWNTWDAHTAWLLLRVSRPLGGCQGYFQSDSKVPAAREGGPSCTSALQGSAHFAKSHGQGQSERGKGLPRAWRERWEQIGANPATIYHRFVQLSLNETIKIS